MKMPSQKGEIAVFTSLFEKGLAEEALGSGEGDSVFEFSSTAHEIKRK
jgi:hypothetical protein